MLCKNPYMKGVIPCGCGQCVPCRVNRRRQWAQRLMLERMGAAHACFVTLTYRDEELQDVDAMNWTAVKPVVPTLVPSDAQAWLKRLRKRTDGGIRYFLVGEYGEENGRPHYHAAVFGLPQCFNGRTDHSSRSCCSVCEMVKETWGLGRIDVGELNEQSASYVAGYVTKKWTKEDSWTKEKLKGRHPEFARMSLKPGIGAVAVTKLYSFGALGQKLKYVKKCLDVPAVLRKNGFLLPLGRYLHRKARESLGRSPDTPKSVMGQYCAELQGLYREAQAEAKLNGIPSCFITPKSAYDSRSRQKIKMLDARLKIFQHGRTL